MTEYNPSAELLEKRLQLAIQALQRVEAIVQETIRIIEAEREDDNARQEN